MKFKISSKLYFSLFALVIVLATGLRVYRLDSIPPAISWDEAAVGYNAFSIAFWGQDEWGKAFPIVFKSFEDDKHPVHIYFTALSVRLFGLSDFTTRLPAAIFGVLNVIMVFFLSRILFKSEIIGLISAFFLAISPYNLQFSRFNHEANFALFFFMFGLMLFFLGLVKKKWYLVLGFISFGISLISYQSSEIVIPPMLVLLVALYFKPVIKTGKFFFLGLFFFLVISSLFIIEPALQGGARIKQTQFPQDLIEKTFLYNKTKSQILGELELAEGVYLQHFSFKYLFVSGDSIPRHSIQTVGEFYKIDLIFIIIGFIALIRLKSKVTLLLLSWILLAPIPAAVSNLEPHAARSLFSMGSMNILSAYGFYSLVIVLKQRYLTGLIVVLCILVLGYFFINYLDSYYNEYSKKYAIEWQYGMKQIVEFSKDHKGYAPVYTTDVRHQPYIFYLYYLHIPQPEFRSSVVYSNGPNRGYNLVSSFDKYHFGDWNFVDSPADLLTLYVITPPEYTGMSNRLLFDVKALINYPDRTTAFYLVSYP